MSSVWKHKDCQKWDEPSQATTISLQRLRCAASAWVETRDKKTQKPIILRVYQERISLRDLSRVFDVHRQSISRWIGEHVKSLPKLKDTLLPAQSDDVLEYDEAWSFVLKKINKRWLWTVMCRRTRQIIAFVISDRSEETCRRLWNKVPSEYRSCISYMISGMHIKKSFRRKHIMQWVKTVDR